MNKATRSDLPGGLALILVVVLLLGAWFIRVYDFAHTPPGMESDTTWDLLDALRINQGVPLMLYFDTRPEPAHRFILAGWVALTGFRVTTARLLQTLLGMLTLALTYRAALTLLHDRDWRRLGGVIAAGALAAMTPHVFLSRTHYRVILVPIVILATLIFLLRARRQYRRRVWLFGGFAGGCGLHTYVAGTMTLPWIIGFLGHQMIFPERGRRLRWSAIPFTFAGLLLPGIAWLYLLYLIPDLYSRVNAVAGDAGAPFLERLRDGLLNTIPAFFSVGFYHPLYNAPDTPFLNPLLAVFAIVGFGLALWRWKHADGALMLGGMFLYSLPGALSREPTHPTRLVGTMPLLALLAGWGAAWSVAQLISFFSFLHKRDLLPLREEVVQIRRLGFVTAIAIALLVFSLVGAHQGYHRMFADQSRYEDPAYWLNIPHNYTMALVEASELLAEVEEPTYVPLSPLNTAAAAFILQSEAFPNVTTWARYGLTTLPEGQVFYPAYIYFHDPAPEQEPLQVLLLPDQNTMVILPPSSDASPVISMPQPDQDGEIVSEYGWVIARVGERESADLLSQAPQETDAEAVPIMGEGLHLIHMHMPPDSQPGDTINVVLEWGVTAPQPPGIASVVQLISLDSWTALSTHEGYVDYSIYPSALWQPGDVIPDVHKISIPSDLPEGVYLWGVGVYTPPRQERFPITASGGLGTPIENMWMAGVYRVPTPHIGGALPGDALLIDAQFEDHITLEGYQLSRNEDSWNIQLYWRTAEARPRGDYTIFLHAMRGDELSSQQDVRPQEGRLPTWAWQPGELVVTTHALSFPADSPPTESLYVGMYSYPSLERLPVTQGGHPTEDGRVLLWSIEGQGP